MNIIDSNMLNQIAGGNSTFSLTPNDINAMTINAPNLLIMLGAIVGSLHAYQFSDSFSIKYIVSGGGIGMTISALFVYSLSDFSLP